MQNITEFIWGQVALKHRQWLQGFLWRFQANAFLVRCQKQSVNLKLGQLQIIQAMLKPYQLLVYISPYQFQSCCNLGLRFEMEIFHLDHLESMGDPGAVWSRPGDKPVFIFSTIFEQKFWCRLQEPIASDPSL